MKIGYLGVPSSRASLQGCLDRGHDVVIVDTRDGMARALEASGARIAVGPKELAGQSDVILLRFSTPQETRDVLFGASGLCASVHSGAIIVDLSDGDPELTRDWAATLAERGIHFIDAPISGHYLAETACPPVILVAGPDEIVETVKPVLQAFAGKVIACGRAGDAHALNLTSSALGIATQIATLEVVAMGQKFGLDVSTMADVISKGSGRNHTTRIVLPRLADGRASSDFALGRAKAILERSTSVASQRGVPMLAANVARGLVEAAAHRYGQEGTLDDIVGLIESMAAADLRTSSRPADVVGDPSGLDLKVGYLGIGTMGGALARRLMLSRTLSVFDVSRDLVDTIAREGATPMPDAARIAYENDVIMMCLPTSAIVREAIFGPDGLAQGLSPGKIIVDQTTGNPGETRAIAKELEALGVAMIDAPVSGGTRGAVAGTIAIICGGPQAPFAMVRPILEQISPNIVYCGGIGNGHAAKLVQNAVAACNRVLTLECAAAACKAGLTLSQMIEPINAGAGWNGGAERIIPALRTDSPTTDFAMALMVKDLRLAMGIGNDIGAPMMIANVVQGLFQWCANERGGNRNLDEISHLIARLSGVTFAEHAG